MNPAPQYYPLGGGSAGYASGPGYGTPAFPAFARPLLATSLWARHQYWDKLPPEGDGLVARPTLERG